MCPRIILHKILSTERENLLRFACLIVMLILLGVVISFVVTILRFPYVVLFTKLISRGFPPDLSSPLGFILVYVLIAPPILVFSYQGSKYIYNTIPKFCNRIIRRAVLISMVTVIAYMTAYISIAVLMLHPVTEGLSIQVDQVQQACNNYPFCIIIHAINITSNTLYPSYGNTTASLMETDMMLTPMDYAILGLLGFTREDVIAWQGVGSCGQYALFTAHLLQQMGLETRTARFIERDHAWAEAFIGGKWYIIDPWFIGNYYPPNTTKPSPIVPAKILAALPNFKGNYTLICKNTRQAIEYDCTLEHGYNKLK